MNRKNFVKILGSAALVPSLGLTGKIRSDDDTVKIKPKRLKKGDKIGIIAPGGFIKEDELKEAVDNLKILGFNPEPSAAILERFGYLAGKDNQRADDLNEMFRRKDIDGIICARGGYGCSRILPLIDYEAIKNNPKVIVGYSDVTALLYSIYAKTGLVCFHGPVGISTFNEFSIRNFEDTLMKSYSELRMSNPAPGTETNSELITIKSGVCTGELIGGNLSIVVSLIGTSYDMDYEGKIVFLEEINEEPYRIDRMLTQMIQSGKFNKAAGIALGQFRKCEPREKDPEFSHSFSLFEVLEDRLANLGIPVIYGLSFGHITDKLTLPFGIRAGLNTLDKTLTLIESAVL